MIWYLLYPFRGTTEPPVLTPDHPLRRGFYSYGTTAGRHWLAFILSSVAVAVLLCYPVFFLYENPTTGFSKLPLHVWTSARLYDGSHDTRPDVEIRQVWVHGDYMKALDKQVLRETLSIQNTLVADDFQKPPRRDAQDAYSASAAADDRDNACLRPFTTDHSRGFHSPLMFWNCSALALESDLDILNTINTQTTRRSYLNLTLRPTSVFAGKSFDKKRVIAADSLVLTLIDRVGTDQQWDDRLDVLAKDAPSRWLLYPRDGHVTRSRLYEFQQKPLSFQDNFFLFLAYFLMIIYVAHSMSKLRAVKSRAGLMITVFVQMAVSIMASFSICEILQIDLARIPDVEYPFVIWVMGLENMFRLINAVLAQPPELPTVHRVATALSEVAHLSLATAAGFLLTLWVLSKVASSMAAFCAFAAIALIFDFIFHLTFFLAVISVDVRRMELQDSLERVNVAKNRRQSVSKSPSKRKFFLDAVLQNRLPSSSRIAGSAISISFVLGLNMHFYSGNSAWALYQSFKSMFHSHPTHQTIPFIAPPINQKRTPAAWLKIQDYRYAQEVLQLVKPNAHYIVARVYDPLIVVLHDSNRGGTPSAEISTLAALWDIIRGHLYPFMLTVIFVVAIITLLMQYMLWNELPEEESEPDSANYSPLSVGTVPQVHRLDVIRLMACGRGHIISISLDRLISISLFDSNTHKYSLSVLTTSAMTPPLWPIVAIAIDDYGIWAALCTQDGNVAFWNLRERRLSHFIRVELGDQQPSAFSLISVDTADGDRESRLIVVTPDATVTEIDVVRSKINQSFRISQERLALATVSSSKANANILALTRSGRMHIATSNSGDWTLAHVDKVDNRLAPGSREGIIKSITPIPSLCAFAAVRLRVVDLVDVKTRTLIYTFAPVLIKKNSLRILSSPRRDCKDCHAAAVHSISLVYTDLESQACVLRTYTLSPDYNDLMCLAPNIAGMAHLCPGLSSAREQIHVIRGPGSWESTKVQSIIGIRLCPSEVGTPSPTSSSISSGFDSSSSIAQPTKDFKNRSHRKLSTSLVGATRSNTDTENDEWEVWTLSSTGEFHTQPLHSTDGDQKLSLGDNELFVADPGPIVPLGNKSVAIGFGNQVKVVMVGNERFEMDVNEYQDLAHMGGGRRRKTPSKRLL